MKQHEAPDPRRLCQLNRDDIARMTPILLDRDRVAERIHCIEDQQVGVSVELDERIGFVELGTLVLAVGRVDDRLAALGKTVPVGISRVKLFDRSDGKTGYFVSVAGLQGNELDNRAERVEIDGKPRSRVLGAQRLAQHAMAAVYADPITGDVSGGEKREAHDVVPVRVRQKYIESVFAAGTVLPQQPVAEFAHARAKVADHIFVAAGNDLHTAGIAAESAAY